MAWRPVKGDGVVFVNLSVDLPEDLGYGRRGHPQVAGRSSKGDPAPDYEFMGDLSTHAGERPASAALLKLGHFDMVPNAVRAKDGIDLLGRDGSPQRRGVPCSCFAKESGHEVTTP